DYITKPFEQDELKRVIAKAVRTRDLSKTSVPAPSDEKARQALVGASASMQEVFKILDKVADTPSTVLITGESGTG
ncbi:MAG TPA: DNA-binding response regulator, partial [Myxococcales bacterium]|nr:DNA-binding response regulator [Myxococcales bacterium]